MRNWIKLFESYREAHYIDITDDGCAVEGYVVSTSAEQLENWLTNRHRIEAPGFVAEMRSRFETIDEAAGYGAQAIILVADLAEEQANGFDLLKWYQGWGFDAIASTSSDPLMMMELDH